MTFDPNKVYGDVPQSFSHRVEYALRRCEKEETNPMKRKPVFIILLVVMLLMTTTAVAAVLSRTTEFFVFEYGERYRETMESGAVAQVNESTPLNGVIFTLADAVITPSQTNYLTDVGEVDPPVDTIDFYATGIIAPAEGENVILLGDEYTIDQPAGYAIYYPNWPKAPEDAPTYAELAKEKGAAIRMVSCYANGIINEETGEVYLGTTGGAVIPLQDGTLQFGIEIPGENVYPQQDSYRMSIYIATEDVDLDGNPIEGTRQSTDWVVTLVPEKAQ